MAVNTVNQTSVNSYRGPSQSIWSKVNTAVAAQDPSMIMHFFDDFLMCGQMPDATGGAVVTNMGQWGLYAAQGSLLTDLALEGGAIKLTSDGDQESVTLASLAGWARLVTTSTLALNPAVYFEARVGWTTVAVDKCDSFIGMGNLLTTSNLLVNTIPISTTDDLLSTQPNLLGFHKKDTVGNDVSFVYQLAAGTAVYPTNLTALTSAGLVAQSGQTGFVKLGFVYDPAAPAMRISSASTGQTAGALKQALLRVYVNGVPAAAFLTTDNLQGGAFPTGFMGPLISNMQTATGANGLSIDWIRMAALAQS